MGGLSLYCAAPSMLNKNCVYVGSCVQRREHVFPNGKLNHGAVSALWTTSVNFQAVRRHPIRYLIMLMSSKSLFLKFVFFLLKWSTDILNIYSFFSGGRHCPATLLHASDLENIAGLQKMAQMLLVFHHKGVDEHSFAYIFVAVINKSQQRSPQALLSAIRQMFNMFFFSLLPHLWPFIVSTSVDLTIPSWTPEMTVRRAHWPHQIAKKLKVQQHYPSSIGHNKSSIPCRYV